MDVQKILLMVCVTLSSALAPRLPAVWTLEPPQGTRMAAAIDSWPSGPGP